jgi:hypothetical protein
VSSLSNIYHTICDITYCSYVITVPLRTYTVMDSYAELLNLFLSFEICLNNIGVENPNNFMCLVHHNYVTIKYNAQYIRVSPKGLSPKGVSPKSNR